MLGRIIAIGVAGGIYAKRDALIKKCHKNERFALKLQSFGIGVIVFAGLFYLLNGRG